MSDKVVKRRGNPNMVKGGPSVNPRGRPRNGESLAEAFRAKWSDEKIVALFTDLAENSHSDQIRMQAGMAISDRVAGKVKDRIEHSRADDFGNFPPHVQAALQELVERKLAIMDAYLEDDDGALQLTEDTEQSEHFIPGKGDDEE